MDIVERFIRSLRFIDTTFVKLKRRIFVYMKAYIVDPLQKYVLVYFRFSLSLRRHQSLLLLFLRPVHSHSMYV